MIKLVHSKPAPENSQRILRVMVDCIAMRELLTRAEAQTLYKEIEAARDALSLVLDRADGKNA